MKLHAFPKSPNTRKVLTVIGLLGLDVETVVVDLMAGDQNKPEFLALNPNGKTPVLEFEDGSSLWESNAIMNRLASEGSSDLWPQSNARYDIVRWQFWEASHWTPACSKFIAKVFFGNDSIDMEQAAADFTKYAAVLDAHLADRKWLSGDAMTTADVSVGAPLCYREACAYPMQGFDNIKRWIGQLEAVPAWQTANAD